MKKNLKIWPALLLAAGLLAVTAAAERGWGVTVDGFMDAKGKSGDEGVLEISISL